MSGSSQENSDPRLPLLNQIQIANPCHVAWNGMTGTERERHCESCSETVHNLIEHTIDEAYSLLTAPNAHVCVRLHRDAAGNVLTKDSSPGLTSTRRTLLQRLGLLAASWLGLSIAGCRRIEEILSPPTQGVKCPPPQPGAGQGSGSLNHSVVMGDVCPTPPPQPNAPATQPAATTQQHTSSPTP